MGFVLLNCQFVKVVAINISNDYVIIIKILKKGSNHTETCISCYNYLNCYISRGCSLGKPFVNIGVVRFF